jgi:hypothetical protein
MAGREREKGKRSLQFYLNLTNLFEIKWSVIHNPTLRVIIGMLTGHSCLRKFLNRIGKAENTNCRYCQEDEDEDVNHVLTECPAFARIRLSVLGKAFPSEVELKEVNFLSLLKFAKLSNVYDTFFRDQEN